MDYVKVYEIFGKDYCADVVSSLEDSWMKHGFFLHDEKRRVENEDDLYVSHQENKYSQEINEQLFTPLRNYIKELKLPSLDGYDGYTSIRYNRYDVGQTMHWHADRVQNMFDGERKGIPTLSVVGALNDDYEGGDFLMLDDEIVDIPAGSVLVFPSTFMYMHKVTPVTKGTRFSFVSWVW